MGAASYIMHFKGAVMTVGLYHGDIGSQVEPARIRC